MLGQLYLKLLSSCTDAPAYLSNMGCQLIRLLCLPGHQKTTAVIALASIAGIESSGAAFHNQQQYLSWLWDLLLSPAGKSLVHLDTAEVQEYITLCKGQVNAVLLMHMVSKNNDHLKKKQLPQTPVHLMACVQSACQNPTYISFCTVHARGTPRLCLQSIKK